MGCHCARPYEVPGLGVLCRQIEKCDVAAHVEKPGVVRRPEVVGCALRRNLALAFRLHVTLETDVVQLSTQERCAIVSVGRAAAVHKLGTEGREP
jgi:hypothetical protein